MLNQLKELTTEEAQKLCNGLRQIPINKQNTDPELIEYWVQGDERYFDIFVHTKNNQITWFQITFRGFYLEYSLDVFKSGKTHEFELRDENKAPSAQFLSGERDLNTLLIRQIHKITSLSSISILQQLNSILQKKLK